MPRKAKAETPPPKDERYYVFFVDEHQVPQMIECTTDSDGLETLGDLVRAENVIGVVRGVQVKVDLVNTVVIQDAGNRHEFHMPIKSSYE